MKGSRTVPAWLALIVVLIDFALVHLCFRYTRELSIMACAGSGVVLYLARLAIAGSALRWACRHYCISGESLGIRLSSVAADFRWSTRICVLGGLVVGALLAAGFVAAFCLGIRLPPPPELLVQVIGGNKSIRYLIAITTVGAMVVTVLAPVTEELIYRSLLLPLLTTRLGLFPAVAVTSVLFGLLHVIPFGEVGIGVPQIIGGVVMATAFAIRWSVVPAMVVHAMGNLFVGTLLFIYVRLFVACPALFPGQ
jgi:membrane protease YdiL (CAAX protease family)